MHAKHTYSKDLHISYNKDKYLMIKTFNRIKEDTQRAGKDMRSSKLSEPQHTHTLESNS